VVVEGRFRANTAKGYEGGRDRKSLAPAAAASVLYFPMLQLAAVHAVSPAYSTLNKHVLVCVSSS